MMVLVTIIIIVVLYMFFRYKKNAYESTIGLVKSNLFIYNNAVSDGYSVEQSLNVMIVSRYMNNPIYTSNESNRMQLQLKNIVLSNLNIMDNKNVVMKILTKMHEIENPDLFDKIRINQTNKIINAIEKHWI